MDKEVVVLIYNAILLSHEKERVWVICSDEEVKLSEIESRKLADRVWGEGEWRNCDCSGYKASVLQDEKFSRCDTTIQTYFTVLNWWLGQ